MSKINAIRVALENHLNTTSPALPAIAWPNVPYTRVEGTPYIKAKFIPVLRRPVVVGPTPEQRTSGLFYLTVFTPEDKGAHAGMALADRLMARFNGSDAIVAANVTVRIEYSEAKMPLHDPPFFAIPVEIGWYAYSR
jgi:hypothetical protein